MFDGPENLEGRAEPGPIGPKSIRLWPNSELPLYFRRIFRMDIAVPAQHILGLYKMVTFNTTTGQATVGTTTITPLADGSNLDDNYTGLINTGIQANSPNFPKNMNTLIIKGNINSNPDGSPNTINSLITDTTKLPSVIFITINGTTPVTKILAYVDQSGTSSYIVKVDPLNMSKLVPGGVQMVSQPKNSPSSVATVPTSMSSGTQWWVWLIVACVMLMVLGGAAFMISKRRGSSS